MFTASLCHAVPEYSPYSLFLRCKAEKEGKTLWKHELKNSRIFDAPGVADNGLLVDVKPHNVICPRFLSHLFYRMCPFCLEQGLIWATPHVAAK